MAAEPAFPIAPLFSTGIDLAPGEHRPPRGKVRRCWRPARQESQHASWRTSMLSLRTDQRGLFEADHLWLDHVGRNTFYGFLASQRGELFKDEEFAELYSRDWGRPSVPPSLLATALLLQIHDRVSDEEARQRAAFDLRWKVALGLEVEARPFAKSTLQLFRAQLILHEKMRLPFERSLELARRRGFLKPERKLRLALDTTAVLGQGAIKDTYNLLADGNTHDRTNRRYRPVPELRWSSPGQGAPGGALGRPTRLRHPDALVLEETQDAMSEPQLCQTDLGSHRPPHRRQELPSHHPGGEMGHGPGGNGKDCVRGGGRTRLRLAHGQRYGHHLRKGPSAGRPQEAEQDHGHRPGRDQLHQAGLQWEQRLRNHRGGRGEPPDHRHPAQPQVRRCGQMASPTAAGLEGAH